MSFGISTLHNVATFDKDPGVRAAACLALGRINCASDEIVSILHNVATFDKDPGVRAAACLALGGER